MAALAAQAEGGPELHPIPERAPDLVKECDTRPDQAFLYALSGDRNPLHRDPAFAKMVGFPRPILHGLCSYGTACRAILSTVADYQPERIRQFDVRFSKPVFPGETMVAEMWEDGGTVSFRAAVKERPGTVVLNNGLCILADDGDPIEAAEALIASGRAAEAARDLARAAGGRARRPAGAADPGQGACWRRATPRAALAEAREAVSLNPDVAVAVLALGEALLAAEALAHRHRRTAAGAAAGSRDLEQARVSDRLRLAGGGRGRQGAGDFARAGNRAADRSLIGARPGDQGRRRAPMPAMSAICSTNSPPITTHRMIGQLAYAAPQILRDLADLVMPGREQLAILDLGCGTGLAGAVFKPLAARLDGIDLSPAMIEKARARGIYDRSGGRRYRNGACRAGPPMI